MSMLSKPEEALQPSPSKATRFFLVLLKALQRWYPLFLISSLSLYLELAVIRWISGEVRLFAYFKNLPLLAAFLGLALGFFLVGKGRDYRSAFPYLLGLFITLVLIFNIATRDKPLVYPETDEFFMWYSAVGSYWLSLALFLGMVIVFFVTILLLFIPLGQAVGEEMALHKPVPAYITNISASLAGIWVFALLSYWRTGPIVWFGLGMLGIVLYHRYSNTFANQPG